MPESKNTPDSKDAGARDPFLASLEFITAFFGHARSAKVLAAGLPIDKKGMTPQFFCQAAARAAFKARIVQRSLADTPGEVFPCVAVLQSHSALVVLERLDEGRFKVFDPLCKEEKEMPLTEIMAAASGYLIYIKPDDQAAEAILEPLDRHWFWGCILDNRMIYLKVMAASFLVNIFALTSPIFIMNFYNRVLPNNAIETGWVLSIGALSVFVFDLLIRSLRGYFIDIAGRRSDVIVAQRLFDQVLDMRLGHQTESTGSFASGLREFDSLREFFNSATMTALVDFPFSLLFICVVGFIGGAQIAVLLLVLYLVVMGVGYLAQFPVQRKVQKAMKTAEQKHGLLVETIGNIETIRGVGGEGALRAQHSHYVAQAAEAGQVSRLYSGLSVHFSIFIQQVSGVLIVLMGMYLIEAGDMSVGGLIACVLLGSRAIIPIGQIAALINRYHHARSAYKNLDTIMRQPIERPLNKKFLHRPHIRGDIQFKDVSFTYTGAQNPVLEGIHLSIRAGEKVAIAGRIGSGKSTLVKLMVDFYEPSAGTIMIDGADMRQVDPADLRRNVAYMGQETALMSGTIRDNIVMGSPHATDEEVLRIAQISGAHHFVSRHPMGYDAPVGERGTALSGGQRQTIALARTLLMDTPVLIMDEPTNSMDSSTEESVLKNIEGYVKDKTLILVTHKPALLKLVTRLVVLDNGRIAMDGPRDQVLAALASGQVKAVQK